MYRISVEDYFSLPVSIKSKIDDRISPNQELEIAKGMLDITDHEMFLILENQMKNKIEIDARDKYSWSWATGQEQRKVDSQEIWEQFNHMVQIAG